MAVSKKPKPLNPARTFYPQVHIEVAVSGGLDSICLLHMLHTAWRTQADFRLSAVHIHHGLQACADDWVDFCRQVCADWQIPLRVEYVTVDAAQQSVEAAARTARYRAFSAGSAQVVALAHHADDQAETVLLNCLRGGGAAALAAMPECRVFSAQSHILWRPLLAYSRTELETYAERHALKWVTDPSNFSSDFRRNALRHHLIPVIAQFWPDFRRQLARTAAAAADETVVLRYVDRELLAQCGHRERGYALACAPLLALDAPLQRRVLAAFCQHYAAAIPSPDALENFRQQLLDSRADKTPSLMVRTWQIFRYRQRLHIWQPFSVPPDARYSPPEALASAWHGILSWPEHSDMLAAQTSWIRAPRAGDGLLTRGGFKSLKHIFQSAGVPALWRAVWPLLCDAQGRIIAVPNIVIHRDFAAQTTGPLWQPKAYHWPLEFE